MTNRIKFLISLGNLIRNGGVKTIKQAMNFAEQQFGKIDKSFVDDIVKVFKKEGKTKKGDVVPIKKKEGIQTLDEFNLSDSPLGDLEKIIKGEGNVGLPKNINKPGGVLDPVIGMTRTLARKILDKKGIEIGKKDPLDVFENTFGEALNDVKNLADDIIEAENTGRKLKSPDELLEIEGLFDIKAGQNIIKGKTDEEVLDMMMEVETEKLLKNWDPGKGRKPSAAGGLINILKL